MEQIIHVHAHQCISSILIIVIVLYKCIESIAIFTGSRQVAAAIALNLAVFSHILNHTLTRLQTAFYEAENPAFTSKELDEPSLGAESSNYTSGHTQLSGRY